MRHDLYQLVKENRSLFWSVGEESLDQLGEDSVVEAILNLGDTQSVSRLLRQCLITVQKTKPKSYLTYTAEITWPLYSERKQVVSGLTIST